MRPDGRLEGVLVAPASRRRGPRRAAARRVGRGHGIGCPKQAPTPVAPTRWSTTMITCPVRQHRSRDDVAVRRRRRDVDARARPLPPSAATAVPVSTCQSTSVAVRGQERCGLGRGHAFHRARRRAAGPGSRCRDSPRPSADDGRAGRGRRDHREHQDRGHRHREREAAAPAAAGQGGRLGRRRARAPRAPQPASIEVESSSSMASPSSCRRAVPAVRPVQHRSRPDPCTAQIAADRTACDDVRMWHDRRERRADGDQRARRLPADPAQLVDVDRLVGAYHDIRPDPADPAQRVAFGTSGHRGSSFNGAFNEAHIVATTEAICRYRETPGHRRPAVHRARHARAVASRRSRPRSRCSSRTASTSAWTPPTATRRRRSSRTRSSSTTAADGTGSPTASSSRRRTTRPRTAASSTTRPTAARPTPTSRAGSRTRRTGCSKPVWPGVRRHRRSREARAADDRPRLRRRPTSATSPRSSTWPRSGRPGCASASTRWAARASPTGRPSPSATAST